MTEDIITPLTRLLFRGHIIRYGQTKDGRDWFGVSSALKEDWARDFRAQPGSVVHFFNEDSPRLIGLGLK